MKSLIFGLALLIGLSVASVSNATPPATVVVNGQRVVVAANRQFVAVKGVQRAQNVQFVRVQPQRQRVEFIRVQPVRQRVEFVEVKRPTVIVERQTAIGRFLFGRFVAF